MSTTAPVLPPPAHEALPVASPARPATRRLPVAAADAAALAAAAAAGLALAGGPLPGTPRWWLALAVFPPAALAATGLAGVRGPRGDRLGRGWLDDLPRLLAALLAAALAQLAVADVLGAPAARPALAALCAVGAAAVLIPVARTACRTGRAPRERALVVGTGPAARLLAAKLERDPDLPDLAGLVDDTPGDGVVGRLSDLPWLASVLGVRWVLVADTARRDHGALVGAIDALPRDTVRVALVPDGFDALRAGARVGQVGGVPVVLPAARPPTRAARAAKRSLDLGVAVTVGILLLPLALAIAVAIRLDSPGPVLFRQERRGRGGRTFRIVKFRTMVVGAEHARQGLHDLNEMSGPLFKVRADPRVTRVGRVLRRTSLDELPQLWNVLRGDMSLVGPRPFIPAEADAITGVGRRRQEVPPGVTGPWQVSGRNDLAHEELVGLDWSYATGWSLAGDLRILCRTVPAVLGRKGAY